MFSEKWGHNSQNTKPKTPLVASNTPDEYTVGEILRAIEGKLAPVACLGDDINPCERSSRCKTLGFWKGLYQVIDDYVNSVTLQDLLKSPDVVWPEYRHVVTPVDICGKPGL